MSKYQQLDAAIVEAISRGARSFGQIYYSRGISSECERIATMEVRPISRAADPERILDRRLQALRKAGEISFAKGAWSVVAQSSEGRSDE